MATLNLTARGVGALEPGAEVWDAVVPGLHVRVGEVRTTYLLRYRLHGQQRRYKLGNHPVVTLADARAHAREVLAKVARGEDPAADRELSRNDDITFRAMARDVLDAKADTTREATRKERERILAAELLPEWGRRPAASITRRDVVLLVEKIARRAPVMANRTLALVKVLYATAIKRGFPTVEASPAHLMDPPRPEGPRERYLDRDEIKKLWRTLEGENEITAGAFKLALLTAQRIGSVCSMRWADVDDTDVWHIPAESFKGKRPHLVPLSPEALAVLEAMRPTGVKRTHVFPGRADGKVKHLASTNRALQRIRERTGLPHFTIHDARTTFRTWATRAEKPAHPKDPTGLGVAPHVADAVLGHKDQSLGATVYTSDKERYLLAEKREALTKWGAFMRAAGEESEAP